MMTKNIFVFDIDGTLANIEHRLKYVKQKPKDFKNFYKNMEEDKIIPSTMAIFDALKTIPSYRIIFCTGRSSAYREETIEWLERNCLINMDKSKYFLFMRDDKDHRPDYIAKPELLSTNGVIPGNTICIFEDRSSVVTALRNVGFDVCQVAKGDF